MKLSVDLRGPLFSPANHGAVEAAIEDTIDELLGRGEEMVKYQLYEGHGVETGHYRRSIRGERTSSRHGQVHDSKVVYGPWLEGVSSRNINSRFKGYSMFRNASQQLEREALGVLNRNVRKAVVRLGG